MNFYMEVFLLIVSCLLGVIAVLLQRILNRLEAYEIRQHTNTVNIALNTQAVADLKNAA